MAEAVKGWRNRAPAPKQAAALTADALAQVREVIRLARRGRGGRTESVETVRKRAALDLATLGVLADGGLRRSEATALTWSDVEWWEDGTARITIQRGKNQSEPVSVAVTEATARALREIQLEDTPEAPVFGPTGESLVNRVRAAARAAGLGGDFTGHSRWGGAWDRDGPAYGGRGSARGGSTEAGPMETRRYGGPLHAERVYRRGAEVADLASVCSSTLIVSCGI